MKWQSFLLYIVIFITVFVSLDLLKSVIGAVTAYAIGGSVLVILSASLLRK